MSELDDLVSRSPPSPGMLTTKERVVYKVVLTGGNSCVLRTMSVILTNYIKLSLARVLHQN